eukprot:504618_1
MNMSDNMNRIELEAKITARDTQIALLRNESTQWKQELQQHLKQDIGECTQLSLNMSEKLTQDISDWNDKISTLKEVRNEYKAMNTNIQSLFNMNISDLVCDHLDIEFANEMDQSVLDCVKCLLRGDIPVMKRLVIPPTNETQLLHQLSMQLDLKDHMLKVYQVYGTFGAADASTETFRCETIQTLHNQAFERLLNAEDYYEDLIDLLEKEIQYWNEFNENIQKGFKMSVKELIPKYLDTDMKWRYNALFHGYAKQVDKTRDVPMDIIATIQYYYPLFLLHTAD